MDADPAAVAAAIVRQLETRHTPAAIGGALCLAYWGVPRATKDVDLNVFVGDAELDPVFDALVAAGCTVDREASLARARERGDVVARHGDMRIDVFVSFHPFHEEVARRVALGHLPDGTRAAFLSAEDLCVFKMLFHRPKDMVDIDRLLFARGAAFDAVYVERWLADLLGAADPRVGELARRRAGRDSP